MSRRPVLLFLAAAACAPPDTGPGPAAHAVRIAEDSLRLAIDATHRLDVTLTGGDGRPVTGPIQWRSGNEAIATVDAGGAVTGRGPGRTWIEASDTYHTDSAFVDVYAAFAAIRAGDAFTCGLTGGGTALCWGRNQYGSLGDGRETDRTRPGLVRGGLRFTALEVGAGSACGLVGTSLWCWGYNGVGQLGDNTTALHHVPVRVADTLNLGALTMGAGTTTCAFDADISSAQPFLMDPGSDTSSIRSTLCWGWNGYGQLLDGGGVNAHRPRRLPTGVSLVSMSPGGYHLCAGDRDGMAWCWGLGTSGQLGDGSSALSLTPVPVAGGHTFATLVSGIQHTCGLTPAGEAWCWGSQTGSSGVAASAVPAPVAPGTTFDAIASSANHTCALAAGVAWCWGDNDSGQLGRGTTGGSGAAAPVATPLRFSSISAGRDHTCAIDTGGIAWCWGGNARGELGADVAGPQPAPVRVAGQ